VVLHIAQVEQKIAVWEDGEFIGGLAALYKAVEDVDFAV
jgi:hypothetical protein